MKKDKEVALLTGAGTELGALTLEALRVNGFEVAIQKRDEVDLSSQVEALRLFLDTRPSVVVHLDRAFDYQDLPGVYAKRLRRDLNVAEASALVNAQFITAGSVYLYPRSLEQDLEEKHFLTGEPEHGFEKYASADYALLMATLELYANKDAQANYLVLDDLYGASGVSDGGFGGILMGLKDAIIQAKERKDPACHWAMNGHRKQSFLHVCDAARAIALAAAEKPEAPVINVPGAGPTPLADVALRLCDGLKYTGSITWGNGPGSSRALVGAVAKSELGYEPKLDLDKGLQLMMPLGDRK